MSTEIAVELAVAEDAGEILSLQRLAYRGEAALYGDERLPPLRQDIGELEAELRQSVCLKAIFDRRIVGSVRGRLAEQTCHVGRLIVQPALHGRGIGSRLMGEIEARFPHARFELFTGSQSEDNLRLYARLGYRECRRERQNAGLTLVYLEKLASAKVVTS